MGHWWRVHHKTSWTACTPKRSVLLESTTPPLSQHHQDPQALQCPQVLQDPLRGLQAPQDHRPRGRVPPRGGSETWTSSEPRVLLTDLILVLTTADAAPHAGVPH